MRISSSVRDMWVYHSSSCRSYCIQILLACYPPVHLGHRASQLLRILTLVMPEAALQTTPTYPSGSGEPENWSEKGQSNTDHSSQSQSTPIPPSTESKVDTRPPPNSAIPSIHLNSITVPSPERVPAIGPVQDNFTEPWEAVKDIPKIARGAFDTLGASAAFSLIFYHALILDTRRHSYYDPNWRRTVHSHHQGNCHNG